MAAPRVLAILAAFFALLNNALCQQCWYPDGRTQSNDKPCNASAAASPCCNEDDMCLDNGLCLHFGIMSRGSCTDQTWSSENCPQYCLDQPTGGVTLVSCNPWGGVFSCSLGNCSKDNLFTVNGGSAVMLRDDQVAPLGSSAAVVVAATDTLRSSASTRNSAATGAHGNTSAFQYTAADMAAVGAGIGVPLSLALAGCIFLLARQRQPRTLHHAPKYPQEGVTRPPTRFAMNPDTPMLHSTQLQMKDGTSARYELHPGRIDEMDACVERQELSAMGRR